MRSYRSPGEVHDGNFFLLRAASIPSSKYGIKVQEQLNGSVPISENVRVSLTASRSGSPMKERLHDLAGGGLPKAKGDGKNCSQKIGALDDFLAARTGSDCESVTYRLDLVPLKHYPWDP